MATLYLMKGLPGSGKSTLAKKMVEESNGQLVRVNRDDLRTELFNGVWSRKNEKIVVQTELARALAALRDGKDVVVDDTNLSASAQNLWTEFGLHKNMKVEWIVVKIPIEECIRRDSLREGRARVGPGVIYNMALKNNLLDWSFDSYVVFDLDGTLTNCDHRIHHAQERDWLSFFRKADKDTLITPVAEELKKHHAAGKGIIILTASPEDYADVRISWLKQHKLPFHYIFLRKSMDRRPDYVVKEEFLALLPYDKIEAVYDDSERVITMFRNYGLNVIDCGTPVNEAVPV